MSGYRQSARLTALLAGLLCLPLAAFGRILLDTSPAPPYQIEQEGRISGTAVDTLDCVFRAVGLPYEVRVVPWRRARFNVQNGLAEGLFSAMPFAEMNQYATLSAPLALEKWYWFGLSERLLYDESFPLGRRLGGVLGSNQSGWLAERGLALSEEVTSVGQLVSLLESGRIDAFLADIHTVNQYLRDQDPGPLIYSRFEKYTPLGAYFSNDFLRARPGFLARFNGKMSQCNTETVQLSAVELGKLMRLVEARLLPVARSTEVISAVTEANRFRSDISAEEIRQLDGKWVRELETGTHELINQVQASRLSQYLQVVEAKEAELFTEILVMDRVGLNVGISRVTTDYWQGDESKYQKVFPPGGESIFIDRIEYDASTGKFQVQVSIRLHDATTSEAIGVMTAGIDVEAMLQE
ncbi:MAG: transporter substrate-binding domain-containing protein [Alcanivoracaceae bacterium]|nr:transporter substrate-binding domain-containing protein [Alcanivoracaceae bacterium]